VSFVREVEETGWNALALGEVRETTLVFAFECGWFRCLDFGSNNVIYRGGWEGEALEEQ
jgi:hypothetical protein